MDEDTLILDLPESCILKSPTLSTTDYTNTEKLKTINDLPKVTN